MGERPGSSNATVVAIVVFVVITIVLLFFFDPWSEGPRLIEREKTESIPPVEQKNTPSLRE